jgi:hypothetical protein
MKLYAERLRIVCREPARTTFAIASGINERLAEIRLAIFCDPTLLLLRTAYHVRFPGEEDLTPDRSPL